MTYKSNNNNPHDEENEIFSNMESQFVDISQYGHSMVSPRNNFLSFKEFHSSHSEVDRIGNLEGIKTLKMSQNKSQRKRDQVPMPSLLHILCSKWKRKWPSNTTKVRLMLLN